MTGSASAVPAFRIKSPRQPMLWAAVAYSSGIVAGVYLWRPTLWWIVAGTFFVAAAVYFSSRRTWFGWALALGAFFLFGALHVQVRGASPHPDSGIRALADGQPLEITAHVTRDGRIQPGALGEIRQTLDVETENLIATDGKVLPVHSGIRLSIYSQRSNHESGDSESLVPNNFHFGDRLRFAAKLRLPRNFRNPGAFDYHGYLADHGIAALGSAKLEDITTLSGATGSRVEFWRTWLHRAIVAKVHQLWPAREAALIGAMILGEESFLDRDIRVDFQRSGTFHVLVVSGMNVSILAFVIFWSMKRLRVGEIPAAVMTIAFCVAYAFLTDVGAPVWRATLMCAIYLTTRLLYRDRAMVNAVGAAALGLLIFDPRQLFTASFQMTFVCVLIVAGIGVPILHRTSQLYKSALANWDSPAFAGYLPPQVAQFQVELRFIAARLALFIGDRWSMRLARVTARVALGAFEVVFISAVMQMGLALPMAYYFHRATTIGLPANVAVIPLTQLMMPCAVGALALGFVSTWLARVPVWLTSVALSGITGTVHGLDAFRIADLRVPTPSVVMILVGATALVLAMLTARRRASLVACGLASIFAVSLAIAFIAPEQRVRPGVLEVTAIDVGEGDSTLLVTPQGRTLLIDAGGPVGFGGSQLDFGEDVVSPYLWERGISRLDVVAITHGHSDHIGGMPAVLKNFRPRELWIGLQPPSRALDNLIAEAKSLGVTVVRHWEGDEINLGGAKVSVLFPPRDWPAGIKPQNNDSMVLRVDYNESSVLLEGDAQKQVERRIAALHHPKVDLLRVGHHGSANASSPELLAAAGARFAVISVGFRNTFGLPRTEVLQRLSDSGARVYRTDLDGAVTFYLDGHPLTAQLAALPTRGP